VICTGSCMASIIETSSVTSKCCSATSLNPASSSFGRITCSKCALQPYVTAHRFRVVPMALTGMQRKLMPQTATGATNM